MNEARKNEIKIIAQDTSRMDAVTAEKLQFFFEGYISGIRAAKEDLPDKPASLPAQTTTQQTA